MAELAEGTRLGIPVLFKSNARNHYERDARAGINYGAGAFSEWPKEPGLAAMRDTALLGEFGRIMRQEWTSIGLRGTYGYMADLATEPRWFRIHETFGEDADLSSSIITSLVKNIQRDQLGPGGVALTMKHFPGGGPQAGGGANEETDERRDETGCVSASHLVARRTVDSKYLLWNSGIHGFKDEAALYDNTFQPYGAIFMMKADGSDKRQLTDSPWEDGMPRFVTPPTRPCPRGSRE
ncbi:hypothetical protein BH11GEM2_BH11GEM2_23400 [soil metagenome]